MAWPHIEEGGVGSGSRLTWDPFRGDNDVVRLRDLS